MVQMYLFSLSFKIQIETERIWSFKETQSWKYTLLLPGYQTTHIHRQKQLDRCPVDRTEKDGDWCFYP